MNITPDTNVYNARWRMHCPNMQQKYAIDNSRLAIRKNMTDLVTVSATKKKTNNVYWMKD